MARIRRMKSKSGIYHVMARGTDKQIIFECSGDYLLFRKLLFKYAKELDISIIAYCFMSNHIHLLIKDANGELSLFMKKLLLSYAKYFNDKYDRCGHLFQDRFKSECVEDDRYLLTVFRYILNNPLKAGISLAENYKWSSYDDFFEEEPETDLGIIKNYIDSDKRYKEFIDEGNSNDERTLERITNLPDRDDAWALDTIKRILGVKDAQVLRKYSIRERNEAVSILRSNGLTTKQIRRLTGIRVKDKLCDDYD